MELEWLCCSLGGMLRLFQVSFKSVGVPVDKPNLIVSKLKSPVGQLAFPWYNAFAQQGNKL